MNERTCIITAPPTLRPGSPTNSCTVAFPLHSIRGVWVLFGAPICNSRVPIKLPYVDRHNRVQVAVTSYTPSAALLCTIVVPSGLLRRAAMHAVQPGTPNPKCGRGVVFEIATMQSQASCLTLTTERVRTGMRVKCNDKQFCVQ